MKGSFNMIDCGVGGQGVVMMANIVGEACVRAGLRVISGELHGLSQRNGSVIAHQRIGETAISPLVPYGEADVILSLEPMEALRYLYFLKPGGLVITNTNMIHPPTETQMLAKGEKERYVRYDEVVERIRASGARIVEVDALELAREAGNPQTENVVMVGALAAVPEIPVGKEHMLEAVKDNVPKNALDVNVRAFELGYGSFKPGT
ncbi:MAG: indolepyruvate ferredoxin oxidoreductase subunit beta [Candidatus Thermoplasmatota archaeon]|nr:indolepyruvate ferredoxin oxidoreductase subunit beta [Candidatus Thermoplasmatota archaeon]